MAINRPKLEEIFMKLRQVEILTGQGMLRIDAIIQIGVTAQTYYRRKKTYGDMTRQDELPEHLVGSALIVIRQAQNLQQGPRGFVQSGKDLASKIRSNRNDFNRTFS